MIGIVITVLLVPFLVMVLRDISMNETILETMRDTQFAYNQDITYNISCSYNWREVFGPDVFLSVFPIFSAEGDGINFAVRFRDY